MFLFNTSYLLYLLFVLSVVFAVFYIWRRIYGLECYSKILEKKITNLKKENKELQEMLNGTSQTSFEDADVIMNKIFNVDTGSDTCCIFGSTCDVNKTETTKITETADSSDPEIAIQNIVGLDAEEPINKVHSLPVAEHNVGEASPASAVASTLNSMAASAASAASAVEKDHDMESVVSDTIGVYNRKKLSKMNLDKLKEICVSMNLSSEGTKNQLIDRIVA